MGIERVYPGRLGRAPVASTELELTFQREVSSALGLHTCQWDRNSVRFPSLTMQQCNAITVVGRKYGMLPGVQGILASIAFSDEDFAVREAAFYAAADIDPELSALLVAVASNHSDSITRDRTLDHLLKENPIEATRVATQIAFDDPDESLRIGALEVLIGTDTQVALAAARRLLGAGNLPPRLHSYCESLLRRGDLVPVKDSKGHVVTEPVERRAKLVATALYETALAVRLDAAKQCFADTDVALSIGLGLALAQDPEEALNELAIAAVQRIDEAVAEWAVALKQRWRRSDVQ